MWLITTLFAAIVTTAIWYVVPRNYRLGLLSLMFWGAGIMIFVDHVSGYLTEGGAFISTEPGDILLSSYILIPALMVWLAVLLIKDPKGKLTTTKGGV